MSIGGQTGGMQREGDAPRGRLRVYLGAAPGVGKTMSMLDEGRRRRGRGTDVVVGLVETHGRSKTLEAIGDLEVVPRRALPDSPSGMDEMDVDAVIARRPTVALVDELAHTNLSGSRNLKRWQDIQLLLDHGIDVISTVNVQHLESLNDVVEAITGIKQRETVPDAVVRDAEAIELVDMSPQALRRRMAHGNIYAPEKIDTALSHYFREGNLTALREIALLWLADRVEEGLETYREAHGIEQTWATRERIVAAVTGGEESPTLMRRAARIATRSSGAEWMAVYITQQDGLSGVSADQLERMRTMAQDLGGTFHVLAGDDPADALLDFARGVNASQVLIGASRRGRLLTALRPGVGEQVIARSGDIDVHVVTHDLAQSRRAGGRRESLLSARRLFIGYLIATLGTIGLAVLLYITPDYHSLTTVVMLMMAAVVATALVGGIVPAVVAAVLSGVLLNFFFIAPTLTLTISDPENVFAVIVFLVVGIAVASVVDLAARRTLQAVQARTEANALAVLSHSLLHTGEDADSLLTRACEVFGMEGAAVLRAAGDGQVVVEAAVGDIPLSSSDPDASAPIDNDRVLALSGHRLKASDRTLLTAYAGHLAIVSERERARDAAVRTVELAEGNKSRTALLAAVSHDLRSPLAAIKAAVSSLRNPEIAWTAQDEADLLETIEESSDRLDKLVGNLLDMSRLQMGRVNPLITDVDLPPLVEWVVAASPDPVRVKIELDQDLPLATADPGLAERVIANVVENSLKHTPAGSVVQVRGCGWTDASGSWVSLRVVDHGRGVPADQRDNLFAPFQRLGDVPAGDGVGLGLAVARGLAESMGGSVTAEDTPGGGLTMVIDLPVSPLASSLLAGDGSLISKGDSE